MTPPKRTGILDRLRQVALRQDPASVTDALLLEWWLIDREDAAFEALVRRHGRMVLGVCRRVLGDVHEAEDAFQATFLILFRKAACIVPHDRVGNWLHGVAFNAALRAKAARARRRVVENKKAQLASATETPTKIWEQILPLLDNELKALPELYRLPIILCHLEGKTRKQVSLQLGWAEGTVASRLARGRALLAQRLRRHGLCIPVAVLTAEVCQGTASATVPAGLLHSTIKAASLLTAGGASALVTLPAPVARITQGVLRAMILSKCLRFAAILLLIGATATGAGVLCKTLLARQVENSGAKPELSLPSVAIQEDEHPLQTATKQNAPDPAQELDDSKKLAFALESMKRNLDGIPEFKCRYTVSGCKAPTFEDAVADRNVERGRPDLYVDWIVKKPVERFVAYTDKSLVNIPVGRLIAPRGEQGPIQGNKGTYTPKVWKNQLWDGTYCLTVGDADGRRASVQRGFPVYAHPRQPGTPLEGEFFRYTEPDHDLKDHKERRVTFAGVNAQGLWQFHVGKPGNDLPPFKANLDPKRGFLPVQISIWGHSASGEGYVEWRATDFLTTGKDRWFASRSVVDMSRSIVWKDGQQPFCFFREFKIEHFDAESKVADEDLAITIPKGHHIQSDGTDAWIVNQTDRYVTCSQLPQLRKELEDLAEGQKNQAIKK
jgi:RNA polymerase sigma factor (sigma-70 family)